MSTTHTDALRPDARLETRMSAAYQDGKATAAARGRRVIPWDSSSTSSVERVLATAWCRGYTAGNPVRL